MGGEGDVTLQVNQDMYPNEKAKFAIAETVVWNWSLTNEEMIQASGTPPKWFLQVRACVSRITFSSSLPTC
jgi:hypothetical protein